MKRLDRPELRDWKLDSKLMHLLDTWANMDANDRILTKWRVYYADQILALIPDIEEAKKQAIEAYGVLKYDEGLLDGLGQGEKQERERIHKWGGEICSEHSNDQWTKRECPQCWQALKEEK